MPYFSLLNYTLKFKFCFGLVGNHGGLNSVIEGCNWTGVKYLLNW
jgi:hypothetical protein